MQLLSCFGIFNVPSSLLVGGLFSTSKCRAAFASENNLGRCRCNFFSMQLLCLRHLSKSVFCFFFSYCCHPSCEANASVRCLSTVSVVSLDVELLLEMLRAALRKSFAYIKTKESFHAESESFIMEIGGAGRVPVGRQNAAL